jgi:tRNA pseudouridine55 synthase
MFEPGFLVIDKPPGITSHDVVDVVRAVTGVKKVGHTGTLDPFATGVLPLAMGSATRVIQFLDESIKVYDALITLGSATDTGDPTGRVVLERPLPTATRAEVVSVLQGFLGQRMQTPPAFSAVKHKGKPLYHYARKGLDVDVEARPIQIHGMDLMNYEPTSLQVRITCSRGTYARVLAHEIAEALGSAGHLGALSRARSGPFLLEDALDLPALAALVSGEPGHTWQEVLLARARGETRVPWRPRDAVREALSGRIRRPVEVLNHLPIADVRAQDADRVRKGGGPPPAPRAVVVGGRYLVVSGSEVVAVAELTARGPKVIKVIDGDDGPA